MAKLKVSLSIGLAGARREDVIDVDDTELSECECDDDREELFHSYWQDWSQSYIDGGFELID